MKDLISIIIPVVKNDPHVAEAIDCIGQSTYPHYEVIVVDEGLERSAQRNIGMSRAKGKYLLILDSDMMITPFLLEECVELMFWNPHCVALYIPERIVTEGWFGALRDWERQFYNGTLVDVVRFVRADRCPKFDEEMHGVEDSDWERRMPYGAKMTTRNHFDHHDKVGVIKYLRKKAYYAKCLNIYKRKNPGDKLLTFRYRCCHVFISDGKWKRFLRSPHLAIGVMLLLFARGLIYWQRTLFYK